MKKIFLQDRTLIELKNNDILAVIGDYHLNEINGLVSYLKSAKGERVSHINKNLKYKVVRINEMIDYSLYKYKKYLKYEIGFPTISINKEAIKQILYPKEKLKEILNLDKPNGILKSLVELINILVRYTNYSENNFGVDGSILAGLFNNNSDIDLCIYGDREKISNFVEKFRQIPDSIIVKPIKKIEFLYKRRKKYIHSPFKNFKFHESRKLEGFINDIKFSIIGSRESNFYSLQKEDRIYIKIGEISLIGKIINDNEVYYNPTIFFIEPIKIEEFNYFHNSLKSIQNVGLHFEPTKREITKIINNQTIEIWSYIPTFAFHVELGEEVFVRGELELILEKELKNYRFRILIPIIDTYKYAYTIFTIKDRNGRKI
ncbi:MAG: nucleotidyltransferase domain-containing protein [Nanopusillaceae archaeon]